MMMAHSNPTNELLSRNVLGGEDRIQPVRSGSLRKMVRVGIPDQEFMMAQSLLFAARSTTATTPK